MKKIIIICFFISLGFAGTYDSLAKNSLKFFKPSIIEDIGNKYGCRHSVFFDRNRN